MIGVLNVSRGEIVTIDLKRIFLNENEQLSVSVSLDLSKEPAAGTVSFTKPAEAEITIANHAGLVTFDADVSVECHFLCDRCFEPNNRKLAFRFSHILVTAPGEDSDDDYIEAPDYMLDTDALLRDDILLGLPSKFLCKDSCKGLCPKCGKNLNEGKCNCPEHEPDPRLAALSALLKD